MHIQHTTPKYFATHAYSTQEVVREKYLANNNSLLSICSCLDILLLCLRGRTSGGQRHILQANFPFQRFQGYMPPRESNKGIVQGEEVDKELLGLLSVCGGVL
jgi:hypothetical protein